MISMVVADTLPVPRPGRERQALPKGLSHLFDRYSLRRLITERGSDAKVVDWLDMAYAEHCSTKKAQNWNDAARCPDLPRVL